MTRFERMLLDNCEECYTRKTYYEGRDSSIKTYEFVGTNSVEIVDSDGFIYIYNGFEDHFYKMIKPEDIVTDEDVLLDFSKRLNYFKHENQMSYKDVSNNTGIAARTIQRYANAETMPSFSAVIKIAKCLHCRIEDLTGL